MSLVNVEIKTLRISCGRPTIVTAQHRSLWRSRLAHLPAERTDVSEAPPGHPSERRDIRRVVDHWLRNTSEDGAIPSLDNFDFSPMKGDWKHRFLICSDPTVENAVFIVYGLEFAKLLNLPEAVAGSRPLIPQIPERYRPVFTVGCSMAMTEPVPARFSGVVIADDFNAEFYRAVFLPISLHPNWSKRLIFGTFNYRKAISVDQNANQS